jgi:hypothetical protein
MLECELIWGRFTFPPINLWSAPKLTYIEYTEKRINNKQSYSSRVIVNPIYERRSLN